MTNIGRNLFPQQRDEPANRRIYAKALAPFAVLKELFSDFSNALLNSFEYVAFASVLGFIGVLGLGVVGEMPLVGLVIPAMYVGVLLGLGVVSLFALVWFLGLLRRRG